MNIYTYISIDGDTQRIEPRPKSHQMTILWIRFIEGGTISNFGEWLKNMFKINYPYRYTRILKLRLLKI